ncbi:MAG TPA: SDR family oxidoreductase [Xanthobacteraceae bacterium]|nr:SDR family oxidoreductase [Xanthobacteraceae bacterium]
MQGEFSSKIVVVTGGSRGIGRAIAASFAGAGAETVIAASSKKNLANAAEAIAKTGGPVTVTCAGDLRQLESCEALFDLVASRFGRCDVLVNSAGATKAGNFLELIDEDWHDGYALKFFAAVRLCRLFWPMLKAASGHVVNIVGGAARTPDQNFLIGGSVNAALANFSKGLADRGKQDGVNVNVIHPGLTETERFFEQAQRRAKTANITPEEAISRVIEKQGIRRIAKPEDIAELALFLCSPRGSHIQGSAIAVDGGATPGFY